MEQVMNPQPCLSNVALVCCGEEGAELEGKDLDLLLCLRSVPHLWSWGLDPYWTDEILDPSSWSEIPILGLAGLNLGDKARGFRVESMLVHIKRGPLSWHLITEMAGFLTLKDYRAKRGDPWKSQKLTEGLIYPLWDTLGSSRRSWAKGHVCFPPGPVASSTQPWMSRRKWSRWICKEKVFLCYILYFCNFDIIVFFKTVCSITGSLVSSFKSSLISVLRCEVYLWSDCVNVCVVRRREEFFELTKNNQFVWEDEHHRELLR